MHINYAEHQQQTQWQNIVAQSEHLKNMAISENWSNFLNANKKYALSVETFFKKHASQINHDSVFLVELESLIKTDQLIKQILESKNKHIAQELLSIQKRKFAENAYHFMHLTQH
ncbi:MAG: hypothetical protein HRU38_13530 [Saccharospirillaceae bacterium]|nr:hypothetical protein [Pseudomonadales bacterium]NRB79665.1 hypothetical protein [Saccharospirillaceae bacterium]